jgi:peptide/nickel transport system ATP-binding protein
VTAPGSHTTGSPTAGAPAAGNRPAVLQVDDLRVTYDTARGPLQAVDGVSFTLYRGERFGLVGESGCGKSTTANAILRLIKPPGRIDGGRILLGDLDLLTLPPEALPRVRWTRISLVMQGAMNSLNPVMRVRDQIVDVIEAHTPSGRLTKASLDDRVRALLNAVGLPDRVMRLYPHELSGGMKQRVCIAMAMALEPEVIIADEPTSALDVVVQRVVAQTLIDVEEKLGASLLLIGHDMGLQAQLVHRLGVMYAGKLVEVGPVAGLFDAPRHPYTQLLISSVPSIAVRQPIRGNPGLPPSLLNKPSGCPFHPRCPFAMDVCREVMPETQELEPGHVVACHLY